MNYLNIEECSVSNGLGCRLVLWVAGCSICCENCHNKHAWDFNSGNKFSEQSTLEILEKLNHTYIRGLTISGGHPFEEQNISEIYKLLKRVKMVYPNKTIWAYSGYTFDELIQKYNNTEYRDIFKYIDVLVDGSYIDEQRDITLAFRGSKNQRVIDVQKSLLKSDGISNPVLYIE